QPGAGGAAEETRGASAGPFIIRRCRSAETTTGPRLDPGEREARARSGTTESGGSDVEEQPLRILDAVLDAHEELHRLTSIHQPVVVAEGQEHHRTDDDLTVPRHRPLDDVVHPEDAGLRRVEDRRREHGAEDAAVRDGEGATREL